MLNVYFMSISLITDLCFAAREFLGGSGKHRSDKNVVKSACKSTVWAVNETVWLIYREMGYDWLFVKFGNCQKNLTEFHLFSKLPTS